MNIKLTKDAGNLICLIYKAYLERRKNGISKSNAAAIGDIDYIRETFVHDWLEDDVYEVVLELKQANLISCDITGSVFFETDGVIYMEERFGNNFEEFVNKLKNIPLINKLLY